jgi:hypothetical protein
VTWRQLSETSVARIKEILMAAGDRYRLHDPATWGAQAALAAEGAFEALKVYQDKLNGGRAE